MCGTYQDRLIDDNANDLGNPGTSIAVTADGIPIITYYDATLQELFVYECADTQCSTGTKTNVTNTPSINDCRVPDMERYPSTSNQFAIACQDDTNFDAKLIIYTAGARTSKVNLGSASNYFNNTYTANIFSKTTTINNFDVAEEYDVEDPTIGPGDVVRFKKDATGKLVVERTTEAYDKEAIGVISTAPGLYLKDWKENKENGRPVALVGRVPVKISNENGEIKRGDYLTPSSIPGVAMKATSGGIIIGRAMEDGPLNESSISQQNIDSSAEDSPLVQQHMEEQLDVVKNILENDVELNNDDVETASDQTNIDKEQLIQKFENEIVGAEKQDNNTLHPRIMMFVDLGFVGSEVYETADAMSSGISILQSDMDSWKSVSEIVNGNFKVKNTLITSKISGTEENSLSILLNSNAFSVTNSANENLFSINSEGKIAIKEGQSVGSFTIPAGSTEIFVPNAGITDNSIVVLGGVLWGDDIRVKSLVAGSGFFIELKQQLVDEKKVSYIVIN
jgi:hypothetical protein